MTCPPSDGDRVSAIVVDAEVGNVLRRMVTREMITAAQAVQARRLAVSAVQHRHGHADELGEHAWTFRANVTFYDWLYVALAELLGVPLVTADARIARTRTLRCAVEVVAP